MQGLGSSERLTSAEMAAYTANRQYVHARVKSGQRIRLNYADPRQYDFVMARLKLAGKTPANSPHLFELIEARRQKQLAQGLKAGAVAEVLDDTTADRREMHFIETASLGISGSGLSEALGTAGSTFPGSLDLDDPEAGPHALMTYVDVSASSTSGVNIGPLAFAEEYENPEGNVGANVRVSTSGDYSRSTVRSYNFDSQKFEDFVDENGEPGFTDSFTRVEAGIPGPQPRALLPQLSRLDIQEPIDRVGPNGGPPDGIFSACIDRSWTNDCDRVMTSGRPGVQKIELPLKGSVVVISAHVFDRAKIDRIKAGQFPGDIGMLKLILANAGGGCDVTNENALFAAMSQFWKRVTLSPDDKRFSWDLTDANVAFFDDGCRQVQDKAKLTMRVPLPLLSSPGNEGSTIPITVTSDAGVDRPNYTLSPITLTNSCLAEGTQIEMGDGAFASVESLQIGQSISNPYAEKGSALTIMDTAAGIERAPMVRIRDEAGRTLLLTEMHPVATPDRGMVQARALKTGDQVMMKDGPSKLADVSREEYSGKVYNLKVGSKSEMASLGPDQTTVYANGFVVGDGQIQSKYESLVSKQKYSARKVAPEWQRDYLMSPHRK